MNQLVTTEENTEQSLDVGVPVGTEQYVTVRIAGQLFGLAVLDVHDILGPQKITRVPLSPPEIAGSLNLRGKIVTAMNMRESMDLPPLGEGEESMHVVVHHKGSDYSLLVDGVGEVLNLHQKDYERTPPTLDPRWGKTSKGIFRLPEELMIVLDVDQILATEHEES